MYRLRPVHGHEDRAQRFEAGKGFGVPAGHSGAIPSNTAAARLRSNPNQAARPIGAVWTHRLAG